MFKGYDIIRKAVEEGAESGWNKAYKNEDCPTKESVIDYIVKNVMNWLDEIIDFNKINY
jgi:1,4-alpha-glucan branching enzyme